MISYEKDFYGWTQEQARLLAAGRFAELDLANLAGEIEDMGSSELREIESRFTRLFSHLLKWKFQPSHRGVSWELTLKEQRSRIAKRLKKSPGLKPHLQEVTEDAYEYARIEAAKETGLALSIFPESMPWTIEQATADNFLPE